MVEPMSRRLPAKHVLMVFLASLLAPAVAAAEPGDAAAEPGDTARGRRIYEQAECTQCHGLSGRGDGPVGLSLEKIDKSPGDWSNPAEAFKLDTDKDGQTGTRHDLKNVIVRGALVFGGSQMMGPTPGLSDDDLDDLVAFIGSLAAN